MKIENINKQLIDVKLEERREKERTTITPDDVPLNCVFTISKYNSKQKPNFEIFQK